MQAWQRLEDAGIEKIGYRTVVRKRFRMNNGNVLDADISSPDGSAVAAVIALTPENHVVIARQFRCGPEMVMDELPGGAVDPGETPEEAAVREFAEEVGYTSDAFEYLGSVCPDGWSNTRHHYFFARDCYKIATHNPEAEEEIETDLISIAQLIANAKAGRMTDVHGVFLAYDKLKVLEEN